jgi:hypothetical protein
LDPISDLTGRNYKNPGLAEDLISVNQLIASLSLAEHSQLIAWFEN